MRRRRTASLRCILLFQFTHPVRGATLSSIIFQLVICVSIHAPRAGCDFAATDRQKTDDMFQFTHPVRGATALEVALEVADTVSIHAPRAGCDCVYRDRSLDDISFNSRTPCGVRHKDSIVTVEYYPVSIHAPRAGCDGDRFATSDCNGQVSIHAPRAGCDVLMQVSATAWNKFQFTHPVRGATRADLGEEPR